MVQAVTARGDKLWKAIRMLWLATVFSAFFRSWLLPIEVPGLGTFYLFRFLLPVTALLYLIWAVREKESFWKGVSAIEKWCYVLIAVMLVYGGISLLWSREFIFSFRRLFNLCFDLCFFFLALRLFRIKPIFRETVVVSGVALAILCALGNWEVYFGGILDPIYDALPYLFLFTKVYQYPVVCYGNTNEYAIVLAFCGAVFLLAAGWCWDRLKRWQLWLVGLGMGYLYFMAYCCNGRLVCAAFLVLIVGAFFFLLIRDRRRVWVALVMAVIVLFVNFAGQYRFIVPPIQTYIQQMKEYKENSTAQSGDSTETPSSGQKPKLKIGNPDKNTVDKEFFMENESTGEKELRGDGSGGVRVRLLLHAFRCFKDSRGLGVGLGNTELLARDLEVIPDAQIWNIHCFIARIVGDYGIFVLLPLCAIAFLLLKKFWLALAAGWRQKDRALMGLAVLFFFALLSYPITSTASADAQDCYLMWFYLAAMVWFADHLAGYSGRSERQGA